MSFLKSLAGPLAGGAINPASGLGMAGGPLSGIGALAALIGNKGGGEGGASPTVQDVIPTGPKPNAAATGLGKIIGVDGAKISSIADSVGKGMNQIAAGGGAPEGYAAPQLPAVNNHMQLLDPNILQALVRHFSGGGRESGASMNVRQY